MTSYTTDTNLPRAYTITRTYNGAKYDLSTQVYCYDMLGNSSNSPLKSAQNATSVVSGLLTSTTGSCEFMGSHSITITSGATYNAGTSTRFS